MDFTQIISEAYNELYKLKFYKKVIPNKQIVHVRYDKMLSGVSGDKILLSYSNLNNIVDYHMRWNKEYSSDTIKIEIVKLLLMTETLKFSLDSFNRLSEQLKENRQAALAAIHLESAWIARKLNQTTNTYDHELVCRIFQSAYISFFPDDTEMPSGKKAEYYYDIINAWNKLTGRKRSGMNDMRLSGQHEVTLREETAILNDPYNIVQPQENDGDEVVGGGTGYTDNGGDKPSLTFGSIIDELSRDMEVQIDIDNSEFIDTVTDESQSQSFGYNDGATDFSYQNIDKRYSTDDAMMPGTVGAYNQVALIFDVSGSMGFIDYSKIALGVGKIIDHYGKIDLYAADDDITAICPDVDHYNLAESLRRMSGGGGTNMLRCAKKVLQYASENNKRYTHVFVFTDGETSYYDLSVFVEANVILYITDPRICPPDGVRHHQI